MVIRPATKRKKKGKVDKDTAALSSAMQSLSVDSPMKGVKDTSKGKGPGRLSLPKLPQLVERPAEFYLWDFEKEEFNFQADVTASIVQNVGGEFDYWLVAATDKEQLLAHRIAPELNQRWSNKVHSLTWNYENEDGVQQSCLFRFPTPGDYDAFLLGFSRATWEGKHQLSWEKAKVRRTPIHFCPRFIFVLQNDEQDYVLLSNTAEDVEMADIEEEEEEEEEEAVASELDPEEGNQHAIISCSSSETKLRASRPFRR
jgi:hypothetical protein